MPLAAAVRQWFTDGESLLYQDRSCETTLAATEYTCPTRGPTETVAIGGSWFPNYVRGLRITSFQPLIEKVAYRRITVLSMMGKCDVVDLLELLGCDFEGDRVHIEKVLIHWEISRPSGINKFVRHSSG
jgi:hypothetical protein